MRGNLNTAAFGCYMLGVALLQLRFPASKSCSGFCRGTNEHPCEDVSSRPGPQCCCSFVIGAPPQDGGKDPTKTEGPGFATAKVEPTYLQRGLALSWQWGKHFLPRTAEPFVTTKWRGKRRLWIAGARSRTEGGGRTHPCSPHLEERERERETERERERDSHSSQPQASKQAREGGEKKNMKFGGPNGRGV